METNEMSNAKLKQNIADSILQILLSNKMIEENDIANSEVEFGYILTREDGRIDALVKAKCSDKRFYFTSQASALSLIDINDSIFAQTVKIMESKHSCLSGESPNESDEQLTRKNTNNKYLEQNGITTNDNLVCNKEGSKLKSIDDICKRAIASLITIQLACDINNGIDINSDEYKEDFKYAKGLMEKYDVERSLNSKERRIVDGTFSNQDAIDMDWEYESYWVLCWALSLVNDIKDGGTMCNCDEAISFVMNSDSLEDFRSKCKLKDIKEVLDMHDLYYRYYWAINNKYLDENTKIGNLDASLVKERYRALEWLLSDEEDWFNLRLNA